MNEEAMGIQGLASQLVSQMADVLPVGYAFGAGMVSAVNPCGFFLLPVYITLYLGAEEGNFLNQTFLLRVLKATWVAVVVTGGFGLLFGMVGSVVMATGYYLMQLVPWFAAGVGGMLVLLGLWMLSGRSVALPAAVRMVEWIGDFRRLNTLGYFLFGLAFGATSLGCTLPVFLAVMGSSVAADSPLAALVQFLSFVLGVGLVIHCLTLGVALVKKRFVLGAMRRVIPHINKISAFFLLTAGGYILYYWYSSGLLFNN